MNEKLIIELLTNPKWLLLILCGMTLTLHLVLVWITNCSENFWKSVDYIWLSIAALALIGLSTNIRHEVARYKIPEYKHFAISEYRWLLEYVQRYNVTLLCLEFRKSEMSPADYKDRVREFQISCEWNTKVSESLAKKEETVLPTFKVADLPELEVNNEYILEVVRDLKNQIRIYNKARDEYFMAQEKFKEKTDLDQIYLFLSPLFLCFALALRITKVSGELKHMRYKKHKEQGSHISNKSNFSDD